MIDDAIDALVAAAPDGVALDGLTVDADDGTYRLAVPDDEHTGLSEADCRAVAREFPAYVTEWYVWQELVPQEPDRWAFLRWLEGADDRAPPERAGALAAGCSREWGQLHVSVRATGDGHARRYEVRHVADRTQSSDALETIRDPHALQNRVRFTDDGDYRPLATAPTLPRGWIALDIEPDELVRAVDTVYPATIANWHREREGTLDVTQWRETAERQTGSYDVVDELEGDPVDWLAQACCTDSTCLKRREWDETGDVQLDAPRGEGEFPCREPCSFVIAAAREFALAERDEPERVELELSEAERTQLERILEAVADDEVAEIRDGDLGDGANRLRVRYLRAKLADRHESVLGYSSSEGDASE